MIVTMACGSTLGCGNVPSGSLRKSLNQELLPHKVERQASLKSVRRALDLQIDRADAKYEGLFEASANASPVPKKEAHNQQEHDSCAIVGEVRGPKDLVEQEQAQEDEEQSYVRLRSLRYGHGSNPASVADGRNEGSEEDSR